MMDWSEIKERDLIRLGLIHRDHFEPAMVELWKRYQKRLFQYIRYKLNINKSFDENRNRYIIEDILQSAFCDVLENLAVYNPKFEVSTWVYTVTNKHIVRYIRETQKHQGRTFGFDDTMDSIGLRSDAIVPDQAFELKEFEQIVIEFVQSLRNKLDAEVFLLYLQNLHTKNIAEKINNTQDAARARLNRVIKQFKKHLMRNYPEYLHSSTLSQIRNLNIASKWTSATETLEGRGSK